MTTTDEATLDALQQRILWLAVRIVDHANHERVTPDGLKVGGHQASSASIVSIMTALWFSHLSAEDRVSGIAAADGRLVDAVRAFAPGICTDNEIAALEETDFFERWAGGIPALLHFFQQDIAYEGPRSTDPEVLRQVAAPVLLLRGQQTLLGTLFADSEQHIAQHVADPHVRDLPGLGHFAPVLAPEPIAKELISFFESVRQPA
jgi:pimeloyl-ACP methyl ester carboxylesterase